MPDDLAKGFLGDLMRAWRGQGRPWQPKVPRAANPHAGRLAAEAAGKVASGRWSRGRAQSTLDLSLRPGPTQTRQAPGARGFGGGGFSGGVSRQLGAAPAAAWVAAKPPRLEKALSLGEWHQERAAHLRHQARLDQEAFDAFVLAAATNAGWDGPRRNSTGATQMRQGSPTGDLRKGMSSAWLARARAMLGGAYQRGAQAAEDIGASAGKRLAEGSFQGRLAAIRGGTDAVRAVRNRIPAARAGVERGPDGRDRIVHGSQVSRNRMMVGAWKAGAHRALAQHSAPAAAQGGRIGRAAYHGAAITAAAGAAGAAGYGAAAFTEKEREQRRNAAKARWANRSGMQKIAGAQGLEKRFGRVVRAHLLGLGTGVKQMGRNVAADAGVGFTVAARLAGRLGDAVHRDAKALGVRDHVAVGLGGAAAGLHGVYMAPLGAAGAVVIGAGQRSLKGLQNAAGAIGGRIGGRRAARAAARAGLGAFDQMLAGAAGAERGAKKARVGVRLAGVMGAGAAGTAAYIGGAALTEKQIEQRRNAARARWAGHTKKSGEPELVNIVLDTPDGGKTFTFSHLEPVGARR